MVSRGELYRVVKPTKQDPKRQRVFVIVSRQELLATSYSTVIVAPIYSNCLGLTTEVEIGLDEGLKHHSCIRCDELYSLPKAILTDYVGKLTETKLKELRHALRIALEIED